MMFVSFITDCGSLSTDGGYISFTNGTILNSTASLSCKTGYDLVGNSDIYCLETGWENTSRCQIQGMSKEIIPNL